jgi:hypothetical protein
VIPLSLILAGLAAAPAPTSASGCADGIRYELDRSAFKTFGNNEPIPPVRLEPFRKRAANLFKDAANRLCARKAIPAAGVARIRRLLIQNGSGAMEPTLYSDPHFGRDTLVFQWVFSEGPTLEVPKRADVESALVCRFHPKHKDCDLPGD